MQLNLILSVGILLILVSLSKGDDEDEECKKTVVALVQKQLESLKICLTEMKFESKKERASKIMCILKCSLAKEGFLEEDGSVNMAGSLSIFTNFSSDVQTKMLDYLMSNCKQYFNEVDPKQESCRSYEPMIRCCHDMLNQIC